MCTEYMYSGEYGVLDVDRATIITLAKIATCNVLMPILKGLHRQVNGLAMGSPNRSFSKRLDEPI